MPDDANTFRGLVLGSEGETPEIKTLSQTDLPSEGDVLIEVAYSSLNYKDGLVVKGIGKLVRDYPHIPGIDLVGTVLDSSDDRYKKGDSVLATGWRMGEVWWGGYAEQARIKADWLIPLPQGLSPLQAMALGTAGLSATLCIMALKDQGIVPDKGAVLVTGAGGGVGSLAVSMLAGLGYEVAAVTGRPEVADTLKDLGAAQIIPRDDLSEPTKKPMESATWAGCIDNVGGTTLARVIGQMAYGGVIAALGNAGGIKLETNVLPFILRGVRLIGIDSVMQPYGARLEAWENARAWMDMARLASMTKEIGLSDVAAQADAILKGQVQGRVLVNPRQ